MGFNWLDLLIGGILLVSFIAALRNGVTREVVRLIALAAGIIGAMWFHERGAAELAPYLASEALAKFVAFVLILVGCVAAGGFIAWFLDKVWGATGLRWFDRLLGGAFGLVRGLAVAMAIVLGLIAFVPIAGAERAVAQSQLAPLVLHGARAAALLAPADLRLAYAENFEKVREVWSTRTVSLPQREAQAAVKASPTPETH